MLYRKTSLTFEHNPPLPFTYSSQTLTYTVCLGCGTAREIRFCDGGTKPVWKLCARHQELGDRAEPGYDNDMLQFLRECVYDGSIPKPPPKLTPNKRFIAPVARHSPMGPVMSTHTTSTRSSSTRASEIEHKVVYQDRPATEDHVQRRAFKAQSYHILWPIPTNSYTHSARCTSNPQVTFTTHGDKSLNITLEPPTIKLITTPFQLLRLEQRHMTKRTRLRQDSWTRWNELGSFDQTTEQDIRNLRAELTVSRVAKGIFFRRCGAVYVNALGWLWEDVGDDDEGQRGGEESDRNRTTSGVDYHGGNVVSSNPKHDGSETNQEHEMMATVRDGAGGDGSAFQQIPITDCTNSDVGDHISQHKRLPRDQDGHLHSPVATTEAEPNIELNPIGGPLPWSTTLSNHKANRPDTPQAPTISPVRFLARHALLQTSTQHDEEDLLITCWAWRQSLSHFSH